MLRILTSTRYGVGLNQRCSVCIVYNFDLYGISCRTNYSDINIYIGPIVVYVRVCCFTMTCFSAGEVIKLYYGAIRDMQEYRDYAARVHKAQQEIYEYQSAAKALAATHKK